MFYTGFADEAADDIAGQIAVTKELGWEEIELRAVGGRNWHDLDESAFLRTKEALEEAGIRTTAMGSNIANWGKDWNEDADALRETLDRAVRRMEDLNGRFVRIMSWKVLYGADGRAAEDQHASERIRRLREIVARFQDAGITPVHENCATWGGMSPAHTLRMLEEVPGLKLVFDTGNPPLTADFSQSFPYPMQSSREYYESVKNHIAHVHIKDSRFHPDRGEEAYHFPGEGDGDVEYILDDLKAAGYDGGFSIEPHMQVVYHDSSVMADAEQRAANYVEYGRRLEKMMDDRGFRS